VPQYTYESSGDIYLAIQWRPVLVITSQILWYRTSFHVKIWHEMFISLFEFYFPRTMLSVPNNIPYFQKLILKWNRPGCLIRKTRRHFFIALLAGRLMANDGTSIMLGDLCTPSTKWIHMTRPFCLDILPWKLFNRFGWYLVLRMHTEHSRMNWRFWIMVLVKKLNSVAVDRKRTIPTERPPLAGEVSAKICG
jgi:hypothetical protein